MEKNKSKSSRIYNVVLVGERDVGKTSLIERYVKGVFHYTSICSTGVDVTRYDYNNNFENCTIKFLDVPGGNLSLLPSKQLFRRAQGVIFVYSTESQYTFDSIKLWVNTCKLAANKEPITMLLLGNKCESQRKVITYEQGEALGKELGIEFFEVSSATGKGVVNVFDYFIEKIIDLIHPKKQNLKLLVNMKKHKKYNKNPCQT